MALDIPSGAPARPTTSSARGGGASSSGGSFGSASDPAAADPSTAESPSQARGSSNRGVAHRQDGNDSKSPKRTSDEEPKSERGAAAQQRHHPARGAQSRPDGTAAPGSSDSDASTGEAAASSRPTRTSGGKSATARGKPARAASGSATARASENDPRRLTASGLNFMQTLAQSLTSDSPTAGGSAAPAGNGAPETDPTSGRRDSDETDAHPNADPAAVAAALASQSLAATLGIPGASAAAPAAPGVANIAAAATAAATPSAAGTTPAIASGASMSAIAPGADGRTTAAPAATPAADASDGLDDDEAPKLTRDLVSALVGFREGAYSAQSAASPSGSDASAAGGAPSDSTPTNAAGSDGSEAAGGPNIAGLFAQALAVDDKSQSASGAPTPASGAAAESKDLAPGANASAAPSANPLAHPGFGPHVGFTTRDGNSVSAELASSVGTTAWHDELGTQLNWMANQGIESAALRLTPEHMGPLEVRISVQGGAASVWFGATQADTRAAIEQALPRLREMFASQGLTLTDSGVFREPPRDSAPQARGQVSRIGAVEASEPASASARISLGLIDTYV